MKWLASVTVTVGVAWRMVNVSGWLETQFEQASQAQRSRFEALLELPDPQLALYLLGGQRPQAPDLSAVVDAILAAPRIMSRAGGGGNLP